MKKIHWIVSPTVDLSCISLGWLVLFIASYFFAEYSESFRIIAVTSFVAHRYFTFPLVYFDRIEFERRRLIYIIAPVFCLGFVALCYYLRIDDPEMFAFWYLFNYFHFVRQKYGILRIYSGKGQWGHKQLDTWTSYLWGIAGFGYMFAYQANLEGRIMHYLHTLIGTPLPIVGAQAIYVAATAVTIAWLIYELRSNQINWPKLLFVASVVFMYGIVPILSTDALFIATSFSHSAEYIALVALTVYNKSKRDAFESPILTRAGHHIIPYTAGFIVVVSALLYGLKSLSFALALPLFLVFTYGTSFMHFIYDGMIWKLRRPRVAHEVGAVAANN